MISEQWMAFHLYYAEPHSRLLVESVKPLVQDLLRHQEISSYFFVRYFDRGSHIRLRLKGDIEKLETSIKPKLVAHFEKYYREYPSKRAEIQNISTTELPEEWIPNNTIQIAEYTPDVLRYGGVVGLDIAEHHFYDSSRVVLDIVEVKANSSYEQMLAVAVQLHISFLYAMGLQKEDAKILFQHILYDWLLFSYGSHKDDTTFDSIQHAHLQRKIISAFEERFEKQQQQIIAFHYLVQQALHDGVEFEQEWLNAWIRGVKRTAEEFYAAKERGEIIDPMQSTSPDVQNNLFGKSILGSYVHMTNNRLGIQNRDEGYLGYLIMRSLDVM